MPKANFLVGHLGQSQMYSAASKETALQIPLPPGTTIEDRFVLFLAFQPDDSMLVVHPLPKEEVMGAEVRTAKKRIDVDDSVPPATDD